MAEQLEDSVHPDFVDHVLSKHPAGRSRSTGETLGAHLVLHGNQAAAIKSKSRFMVCSGGWRGGKSFVGALALYLDSLWRAQVRKVTDDLYGVVADSYLLGQEEMRHLDRLLVEGGVVHNFHTPVNQSWRITFPHKAAEFVSLTAGDAAKIASRPYRALVGAEAAQMSEEAYTNMVGRVSETRGWCKWTGTFENEYKGYWFRQKCIDWANPDQMGEWISLPSWENLAVYPGGREDSEILARELTMPPDTFSEKYAGIPVKRSDLVLKQAERSIHVKSRFPMRGTSFDPEVPVFLFSDPGTAHAYSVLAVQAVEGKNPHEDPDPENRTAMKLHYLLAPKRRRAQTLWVIDAVYRWGRTAVEIMDECAARPWAANVSQAVMDFAARQRRAEGEPIIEQWQRGWKARTGHPLYVHAEQVPLLAGYDIHRRALLNAWPEEAAARRWNHDKRLTRVTDPYGPRLMFDPVAAAPFFGGVVDGRSYLGEYNLHRERHDSKGTVVADEPIDTDNDGIKALNYGCYFYFGSAGDRQLMSGIESMPYEMSVG